MPVQKFALCLALLGLLAACGDDDMARLRKAAEQGNGPAQHNLAAQLSSGDEKTRDYPQAVTWYRKASAQGIPESAYNLGLIYSSGAPGVERDRGEACRQFRLSAEKEYPNGMYRFGLCLKDTDGNEWLRRAAEKGVADAAAEYGVRIMYGHGIGQDIPLGVAWEKRSAEMGSAMGMHNYAVSNSRGVGVPKNEQLAFEWHSRAVAAGYCSSFGSLAAFYRYGVVVQKDERKALQLIHTGAGLGDKEALVALAMIFEKGELGEPKDQSKAAAVRAMKPSAACGS